MNYKCPYRTECNIPKEVNRCNTPKHEVCIIYQRYEIINKRNNRELGIGAMVEEDWERLK